MSAAKSRTAGQEEPLCYGTSLWGYPFGLEMEASYFATQVGTENKYQYNGKELNEDFGLNWYAYGARYYDPAIGRFTGVDPIADQFAWVTVYNYAENEPVANIDLHGLQKYYTADGKFIKQNEKDNSIRVLTVPPDPNVDGSTYKNNSATALNHFSIPAQIATKDNKDATLISWAKKYKGLSSRYNESRDGDREYAMSLFSKELTNKDGSTIKVFVEGSTAKGSKSLDGISLSESKSPFEGWTREETIHTHRWGDDPGNFSDDPGFGGMFQGDIQTSIKTGKSLFLAVPSSNYIGAFYPSIYNEKIESLSHESAKKAAINKSAIRIQ